MGSSVKHFLTEDGSSTLFSERFNAYYHSTHGAINESQHVFIEYGLNYFFDKNPKNKTVSILEFGLGTGLNPLLTFIFSLGKDMIIDYETLEAYPIPIPLTKQLNYTSKLGHQETFDLIHESQWNETTQLTESFRLLKRKLDFKDFLVERRHEIIFFDAFGPSEQEYMWDVDMMQKCYDSLAHNGILVTFCAKGSFKRALRTVGFKVEALPGPPGKREMTRAIKI